LASVRRWLILSPRTARLGESDERSRIGEIKISTTRLRFRGADSESRCPSIGMWSCCPFLHVLTISFISLLQPRLE
jgi:hypothetical protein